MLFNETNSLTISRLSQMAYLGKHSALSPEDHASAITLALLQCQIDGIALLTDGMFGKTRTGSSTCEVLGIAYSSQASRNAILAYLQSAVRYAQYAYSPESLDARDARKTERHATCRLREEANRQRNSDRIEAKAAIDQALAAKAITRDQADMLLSKLADELPVLTGGRQLYALLKYWGIISKPQFGPAPLSARTDSEYIPSTDEVFAYLREDTIGKYIPQ